MCIVQAACSLISSTKCSILRFFHWHISFLFHCIVNVELWMCTLYIAQYFCENFCCLLCLGDSPFFPLHTNQIGSIFGSVYANCMIMCVYHSEIKVANLKRKWIETDWIESDCWKERGKNGICVYLLACGCNIESQILEELEKNLVHWILFRESWDLIPP